MNNMMERLETIARRYEELNEILMDPSIANDVQKMTEASKEQASLENAYQLYQEYKKVLDGIEEAKELLKESDPEIKEMAELELSELEEKKPQLEEKLHLELIPKDPNDNKNVIVEIRGAAGGDEGNIFAGDLYRMYVKYAESQGWKIEVLEAQDSEAGGYSLISFMIKGEGVYSGKERYIFTMVVSSYELKNVIHFIKKKDPMSFVEVTPLSQVYGRFYTKPVK